MTTHAQQTAVCTPALLQRLHDEQGYRHISGAFDGSGDEGDVRGLRLHPGDLALEAADLSEEELEAIDDHVQAQLPSGWETNHGAYGRFHLLLPSGTVQILGYQPHEPVYEYEYDDEGGLWPSREYDDEGHW